MFLPLYPFTSVPLKLRATSGRDIQVFAEVLVKPPIPISPLLNLWSIFLLTFFHSCVPPSDLILKDSDLTVYTNSNLLSFPTSMSTTTHTTRTSRCAGVLQTAYGSSCSIPGEFISLTQ